MAKTPQEKYEKKKRELNLGLANNAFGTGAGLAATGMAYNQARKIDPVTMRPKNDPTAKPSRTLRALKKLKMKPKAAAIAAGTALVAPQAINMGLDAQSAYYFGRERKNLRRPAGTVQKSDDTLRVGLADIYESPVDLGTGQGYNPEHYERISKRTPRGDEREEARLSRAKKLEVLGYTGAAGMGAAGAGGLVSAFRTGDKNAYGGTLGRAALKRAKGKKGLAPRKRFFGGAGLVAAAPIAALANREAASRSRETWR